MRLLDLEPQFLKITQPDSWSHVGTPGESDGIIFLCPVCFVANKGPIGTHSIICWKPNVPKTQTPGPGRWSMTGNGYADLSLVAGSSSVFLTSEGGCKAHFFVENGQIRMA